MESPIQSTIDKFNQRLDEYSRTDPKELNIKNIANNFRIALDMREGLMEAPEDPELLVANIPWVIEGIKEFTKILVSLNYYGQIEMFTALGKSIEQETQRALEDEKIISAIRTLENRMK